MVGFIGHFDRQPFTEAAGDPRNGARIVDAPNGKSVCRNLTKLSGQIRAGLGLQEPRIAQTGRNAFGNYSGTVACSW